MTHKLTQRQVTRVRKEFDKKRNRVQAREWLKARRQEKEARRSRFPRSERTGMEPADDALDGEGSSDD